VWRRCEGPDLVGHATGVQYAWRKSAGLEREAQCLWPQCGVRARGWGPDVAHDRGSPLGQGLTTCCDTAMATAMWRLWLREANPRAEWGGGNGTAPDLPQRDCD